MICVACCPTDHPTLVITDEVYDGIYFGPDPHLAAATVGDVRPKTPDPGGRFRRRRLPPNEPGGSYYLFVDCSRMGATTGVEATEILLRTVSSERRPARRAT